MTDSDLLCYCPPSTFFFFFSCLRKLSDITSKPASKLESFVRRELRVFSLLRLFWVHCIWQKVKSATCRVRPVYLLRESPTAGSLPVCMCETTLAVAVWLNNDGGRNCLPLYCSCRWQRCGLWKGTLVTGNQNESPFWQFVDYDAKTACDESPVICHLILLIISGSCALTNWHITCQQLRLWPLFLYFLMMI